MFSWSHLIFARLARSYSAPTLASEIAMSRLILEFIVSRYITLKIDWRKTELFLLYFKALQWHWNVQHCSHVQGVQSLQANNGWTAGISGHRNAACHRVGTYRIILDNFHVSWEQKRKLSRLSDGGRSALLKDGVNPPIPVGIVPKNQVRFKSIIYTSQKFSQHDMCLHAVGGGHLQLWPRGRPYPRRLARCQDSDQEQGGRRGQFWHILWCHFRRWSGFHSGQGILGAKFSQVHNHGVCLFLVFFNKGCTVL